MLNNLNYNVMEFVIYNSCKFDIVRYYLDKFVVRIVPLCGVFTSGESEKYVTDSVSNLTNLDDWVKEHY